MNKKGKTQRGITLIALVITIIVMLILVAVIISMAVNGGLFDYAGKAVGDTNNAIKAEQQLANGGLEVDGVWYDSIDDYINNKPITTGAFVEYGVAYTDAYISKEYTTTNGWRLLDYTDNGDGTISDVKLISTGIPAKLYYYCNDTTNSSWYVTDETKLAAFKEVLGGDDFGFYTGANTYYGLQAAAGMYYNFGDIKFAYGTENREESLGYFTSITVNGTTYNADNTTEVTGKELFKVGSNVETVRLLTLKEVNEAVGRTDIDTKTTISTTEDSIGLYRLDQLSTATGMSDYSYDAESAWYWLSSPGPFSSSGTSVLNVSWDGGVYTQNYYTCRCSTRSYSDIWCRFYS